MNFLLFTSLLFLAITLGFFINAVCNTNPSSLLISIFSASVSLLLCILYVTEVNMEKRTEHWKEKTGLNVVRYSDKMLIIECRDPAGNKVTLDFGLTRLSNEDQLLYFDTETATYHELNAATYSQFYPSLRCVSE